MHRRARMAWVISPRRVDLSKLTVEQNILAILEMLPGKRREKKQRCEQLLRQFGIENLAKNQALTLAVVKNGD